MINYGLISSAIDYYQNNNYKYIEVPWWVDKNIDDITKPEDRDNFLVSNNKTLVASGEQSFLQLVHDGILKSGKFVCCTPCFRNEPMLDDLHHNWFVKVELICVGGGIKDLLSMLDCVYAFYYSYLNINIIETSKDEFDIIDSMFKIELGSYGVRNNSLVGDWVYGTGCAEPRLSTVINKWRTI